MNEKEIIKKIRCLRENIKNQTKQILKENKYCDCNTFTHISILIDENLYNFEKELLKINNYEK